MVFSRGSAHFWIAPAALTALLLGATPSVLAAAPAEGDQGDNDAFAKKYYDLGRALYLHSDYEGAIGQFRAAYRLSHRPALLFNIARSHEALGQMEQAIQTYREYLQSSPPDSVDVQTRIANLQVVVDKQRETSRREQLARQEAATRRGSSKPGWITVGAGAAVAVLGAVFAGLAKGRQSDAEQAFKTGQEYTSIQSTERGGRAFGVAGPVLLGVGGAAIVAGGVLLILHYRHGSSTAERAAWLTPVVAPGSLAFAAGWRF
jgi:tetratricopeptide (TPR) repeat protein